MKPLHAPAAVAALLSAGLLAACAGATTPSSPSSGAPTAAGGPTTMAVTEAAQGPLAPAVAVVKQYAATASQNPGLQIYLSQGTGEESLAYGQAVKEPARPMAPEDRLPIASAGKPMVAAAVLALVQRGLVKLDDPIDTWLAGAVKPKTGITVEHLLTLSSGLPNYGDSPAWKGSGQQTSLDLVALVKDQPLDFPPGTSSRESNTNFAALAVIAEKASGSDLSTVLGATVWGPAGLVKTTLGGEPTVHGYQGLTDVAWTATPHPSAAAGIVSNAHDLGRFYRALLDGKILPKDALATMTKPRTSHDDGDYGYGIVIRTVPCGHAIGHFGLGASSAAGGFAVVETGRVVAITGNSNANDDIQAIMAAALCA